MKRLKLSLLAVGFLLIAIGLYTQRGIGVIAYITEFGIPFQIIVAGFVLSSIACGIEAIRKADYNLLWYVPYFLYVCATWMSFFDRFGGNAPLPIATPVIYSVLYLYMFFDWLIERRLSWSKIRLILSLR